MQQVGKQTVSFDNVSNKKAGNKNLSTKVNRENLKK